MLKKLRQYLNEHAGVATGSAVALLIGALLAIAYVLTPPEHGPVPVYFYDLNSGQLFTADSDQIPPIAAPGASGGSPAGVRAYVFACGDCSDKTRQFIAWLEMYTPKARAILTQPLAMAAEPPPPPPPGSDAATAAALPIDPFEAIESGHIIARFLSPKEKEARRQAELAAAEEESASTQPAAADKPGIQRDPFGLQWVLANSEEGMQITMTNEERCAEGVLPMPCLPEQ